MIPKERALICWFYDKGVTRVAVMDFREASRPGTSEHRVYHEDHVRSMGANCSGWCDGKNRSLTPEFIFAELVAFYGFRDSLVAEQAMREFAKIDSCGWARKMVPHVEAGDKPVLQWRWASAKA